LRVVALLGETTGVLREPDSVNLTELCVEAGDLTVDENLGYFELHLPYLCRDAYLLRGQRPASVLQVRHGSFLYVFDHYTYLESIGEVAYDRSKESRLIVACGRSAPRGRARDDHQLRGWVGPTAKMFGASWDKGHYIGHALGGAVDGIEANVFVQRRDLNRGWSAAGKTFRKMEDYCTENLGTFCFARPIYMDGTSRAGWLEFGLVQADGRLWVECFDNRGQQSI